MIAQQTVSDWKYDPLFETGYSDSLYLVIINARCHTYTMWHVICKNGGCWLSYPNTYVIRHCFSYPSWQNERVYTCLNEVVLLHTMGTTELLSMHLNVNMYINTCINTLTKSMKAFCVVRDAEWVVSFLVCLTKPNTEYLASYHLHVHQYPSKWEDMILLKALRLSPITWKEFDIYYNILGNEKTLKALWLSTIPWKPRWTIISDRMDNLLM